jgi:NAD-dependent dihydropyrimidine dehydrogenase PreA subunit
MSHGIRPTGFKVRIKAEKCVACGKCIKACARKNFKASADDKIEIVDPRNCNGCTKCRDVCATNAIAVAPEPMRGCAYPRSVVNPASRTDGVVTEANTHLTEAQREEKERRQWPTPP